MIPEIFLLFSIFNAYYAAHPEEDSHQFSKDKSLRVNSFHHQAVKETGKGFDIIAMADNETIEGIVHKEFPIFGVQWHPERMCFSNKREDTADGSLLLASFLNYFHQV